MNWDAIGAIGELIGALVVLGTLAYLAIQIRQSSQATRSATEMQATEMLSSWAESRSRDPDYQRIWNDLAQGKDIAEEEKIYFVWSLAPLCTNAQGVLDQYQAGLVSERCWQNFERSLIGLRGIADFVSLWWKARDGSYSTALYEHIDSVMEKNNQEWTPGSSDTWATSKEITAPKN